MRKSKGHISTTLIECINYKIAKYRIRWDFQPYEEEVSFMEDDVLHKPTLQEVKEIILGGINQQTYETILSGFKWKEMPVWLSHENQFNYKSAYDLAVQTNGANLPVTFKFGSIDEPIYHKFTTIEELQDFYLGVTTHINSCLQEGWEKKDSIDWSEYEELLKKI